MKEYTTVKVVRLHTGELELTPNQAEPRKHNLELVKSNVFKIVNPVEFKAGEKFGYAGQIPKSLASSFVPEGSEKEKPSGEVPKKLAPSLTPATTEEAENLATDKKATSKKSGK